MIEHAKQAAEKWLAAFELPSQPTTGEKDLAERIVRLCSFPDEDKDTIRFFFPRRTVLFLNDMNNCIHVAARKSSALSITP